MGSIRGEMAVYLDVHILFSLFLTSPKYNVLFKLNNYGINSIEYLKLKKNYLNESHRSKKTTP
jgi:hypothetical protein